jgi:hypothetical protein
MVPTLMSSVVRGSAPLPLGFWKPAAAGAAAISPLSFPNLGSWWKADAITGLSDGDPVTNWPDSNLSNHLTGVTTTRPLWKANLFGDKPVVRFDGADDKLSMASTLQLNVVTTFTVFVVMAYGNPTNTNNMLFGNTTNNDEFNFINSNIVDLYNEGASDAIYSTVFATALTSARVAIVKRSAAGLTFRENKTSRGTDTFPGPLTWNFTVMGRDISGLMFKADLAEVLVYDDEKDNATCDALYDGYLKPKYSVLP